MDVEPEREEPEVKGDTGTLGSAHPLTADGNENEKEGVPAEVAESDHDEENSTEEAPVEKAATSEPEDNGGHEPPGVDDITTSEDLDVKVNEVNGQLMSHDESVVFEINSDDGDGPPRLHLETPERETTSPSVMQEEGDEAEEEEPTAAPADQEDIRYEEHVQLLQELCEGRDQASQRSSQLHMKLAEYFRKKAGDDAQPERETPASEQLQEYEKYINLLTDLKQQLLADSEAAQQQTEELSLQSQEKLDKVGLIVRALYTVLKSCLKEFHNF